MACSGMNPRIGNPGIQALRQGQLSQAQARLTCRVADDPWIERRIEHARRTTVRFLREDVEAAEAAEADGHFRAPGASGRTGEGREDEDRSAHFRAPRDSGRTGEGREDEDRSAHSRAPRDSGASEGGKQPLVPVGLPFRQPLKHLVQAYAAGNPPRTLGRRVRSLCASGRHGTWRRPGPTPPAP